MLERRENRMARGRGRQERQSGLGWPAFADASGALAKITTASAATPATPTAAPANDGKTTTY